MKQIKVIAATGVMMLMSTGAFAQANLAAETASSGGAVHLFPGPLDRSGVYTRDRQHPVGLWSDSHQLDPKRRQAQNGYRRNASNLAVPNEPQRRAIWLAWS